MRRLLPLLAVLAVALQPLAARAQAVGNPVFSHYDFVLQGTLEYGSIDRDLDAGRSDPESSEVTLALFKGIVGITPRLDLYGMVGQVDFTLCTGDAQEICGEDGKVSASDIAYGGGARWTFWEGRHVEAAVGAQALFFSVDDNAENTNRTVDWADYQLFAGASFPSVPHVTPYLGAVYDIIDAKLKGPNTIDLEADSPGSAFVGIDIPWGDYFSLSLEGHFGDNTGWAIGLNARY